VAPEDCCCIMIVSFLGAYVGLLNHVCCPTK
jgi:hypothetical protein